MHGTWNRVAAVGGKSTSVNVTPPSANVRAADDGVTVNDLTRELGYYDNGRAVRAALRKGLPNHVANLPCDSLTLAQARYVRGNLSPRRSPHERQT
ncbi:hypothetical protein IWX78_003276 [Mycetocola sp. CAN_C7]